MAFALARVSISTRRKLASILLAVTIFALLAGLTSFATRGSVVYALINSMFVGTCVGLFEQFYVQSLRGRWLRSMHPLLSIYDLYGRCGGAVCRRHSPVASADGAIGYVAESLSAVAVGIAAGDRVFGDRHRRHADRSFHRHRNPVSPDDRHLSPSGVEEKVLLFLDINNSTGLAERLGAVQIKSLVGKFLFDISKPITDYGGEIYLYKGDGLIALWNWNEAIRGNRILRAIDAIFASVRREQAGISAAVRRRAALPYWGARRRGRGQRAR